MSAPAAFVRASFAAIVFAFAIALAACTTAPQKSVSEPQAAPIAAAPAAKPSAPPPKPEPVPRSTDPVPSPAPPAPSSMAAEELRRGQQRYDEGEYKEAAVHFKRALEQGLGNPADQAAAHKHLAFIACVARRTSACRSAFRKAFEADAAFDLTAAEAGHPMWGPVFRSVKAALAKKPKPVARPR